MHKAKKYESIYRRDVQRVTTVTGAAKIANVSADTILYHIYRNNIYADLIGRIYLVSVQSVKDLYQIGE